METGSSDRKGEFRLLLGDESQASQGSLRIVMDGHATRIANFAIDPETRTLDFGDITLPPGGALKGQVVNQLGVPLTGVFVALTREVPPDAGPLSPTNTGFAGAHTDKLGYFRVRDIICAGEWKISVKGSGVTHSLPTTVVVSAGTETDMLVTCEQTAPMHGVVLSEEGGFASGLVQAFDPVTRQALSLPVSLDHKGQFQIFPSMPVEGEAETLLLLESPNWQSEGIHAKWGDEDLVMTAKRKWGIELRVLSHDTGEPILEYGVSFQSVQGSFKYREIEVDDQGRSDLSRITGDERWLYVIPRQGLGSVGPIEIAPNATQAEVAIGASEFLSIQVNREGGAPVSSGEVTLVGVPDGMSLSQCRWLVPLHKGSIAGGVGVGVKWASCNLNAAGQGELELPNVKGWQLLVVIQSDEFGETCSVLPAGARSTEVQLEQFGTLICDLQGAWPDAARVQLERDGGDPVDVLPVMTSFQPRSKSGATFHAVPHGTWRVVVDLGGVRIRSDWRKVSAGKTTIVDLESTRHFQGEGEVHVSVKGVRLEKGVLMLTHLGVGAEASGLTYAAKVSISEGIGSLPVLALGKYECAIVSSSVDPIVIFIDGSTNYEVKF